MGIDLLSWALSKNGPSWPKGVDRTMFLVLAEASHDTDAFCWIGLELIRLRCNLVDRTSVQRTLTRLIQSGWIANDERYVARAGRPVDGFKRGWRLVVPPDEWAVIAAKHSAPPRPPKESRSPAAILPNAAPPQGNAAPEPSKCRSGASALRKEPLRTLTEPLTPPTPLPGGAGSTVADQLEAIVKGLWSERQIRLTAKARREAKHRLRAGESPAAVFAWLKGPDPTPTWAPPAAHRDASRLWQRVLDVVKESSRISAPSFVTWLRPLDAVAIDQPGDSRATLTIAAPTAEFSRLCELNHGPLIREAALRLSLDVHFWQPAKVTA